MDFKMGRLLYTVLIGTIMGCSADVVGYFDQTYAPKNPPQWVNMGIAFSGWSDWSKALQDSTKVLGSLAGEKWIAIGGGKPTGKFSSSNLGSLTWALNNGKISGYQGIAFDIEECETNGLEGAFAGAIGAAKGHGLKVLVTTSHAAPYKCGDAQALMRSFFSNSQIDYLSPQLYQLGTEGYPSFDTGSKGIEWWEYAHARAQVVPSVVSASQYGTVRAKFQSWGIHTVGYIQWNGTPAPSPPPPHPGVHGSYTIKQGDNCWAISKKFCGDGDAWQKDICNGARICTPLQVGEVIKYDCSGTGQFCGTDYILI